MIDKWAKETRERVPLSTGTPREREKWKRRVFPQPWPLCDFFGWECFHTTKCILTGDEDTR